MTRIQNDLKKIAQNREKDRKLQEEKELDLEPDEKSKLRDLMSKTDKYQQEEINLKEKERKLLVKIQKVVMS